MLNSVLFMLQQCFQKIQRTANVVSYLKNSRY